MLISDIKPYPRNARHNEKAIPVVAESIKKFGLRGTIGLESPENPVIVFGHTRVEALKSLGWTEIPDDKIEFCDDLSEDDIKAFRLADNKTGEVSTWNKALLKSEVRALELSGMDMSRFKFDFKSRRLPYGAERLKTDNAYNLQLVNAIDCDANGMPRLKVCEVTPKRLLPFNYAKTAKKHNAFLHFFIDDYQFERLWNQPETYLDLIRKFDGLLSPDFSLYMDMPLPMQRWNEYRRRALMHWWQRNKLNVIPTLSWTTPESYGFCFDGIPKGSTVAVSSVGVKGDEAAMAVWHDGMTAAMERIEPERVILYGSDIEFDFGESEVIRFKANTAFKEK